MRTGFLFGCVLFLSAITLSGMEPPSAPEIDGYRKDGTLQARIDSARAIGDHKFSADAVARLRQKLRTLSLIKNGVSPQRAAALAPPPAWRGLPTTGAPKIFVLLIDFSDYASYNSSDSINSKIFGDGAGDYPYESLKNYYFRSSYGALTIGGATLGWYHAGPRSAVPMTTEGRETLIKQAVNYFHAQGQDFSQFDNNGDGTVDYFSVIWTGPTNGWANFWWAYDTRFGDASFLADGKKLGNYSWQYESYSNSLTYGTGTYDQTYWPKTLIHETGHALGVPDYYDYDASVGPAGGIGGLDMMAGDLGDHNCFSKFMLDWLTPANYDKDAHSITLRASDAYGDSVKIIPGGTAGDPFEEFFMVQNRRRSGNDMEIPADGLLIWHVDARLNAAGTNFLYDESYTDHKLLRLMEADGLEDIAKGALADAGDFYTPGAGFGPATFPDSGKYDGSGSGVFVSNIGGTADSRTLDCGIVPQYLSPAFTQVNASSLTAVWTSIPGAAYVAVLASDAGYANILSSAAQASNSVSFAGLSSGVKYYFEVKLSTDADAAYLSNRISTMTQAGAWSGAGPMSAARGYHAAALLPDGKVLAAGGMSAGSYVRTAELYDPAAGSWSAASPMATARYYHTVTLLPNGKALVTGGPDVSSAELYDPDADSWSSAGSMSTTRFSHTATLLPNGKVLVAGGYAASVLASAELYDPELNTWSSAGSMSSARYGHTAALLPNGKVLVAGGNSLSSAELYDPSSNSWSAAAAMSVARTGHASVLLAGGKVFVCGGDNTGSAEIYDPSSNTWSGAGTMSSTRSSLTATLLPGGKVLAAGGYNGAALSLGEIYDPDAKTWMKTPAMSAARANGAAALLPNGMVLISGGWGSGGYLSSSERFQAYDTVLTRLSPAFSQVYTSSLAVAWAAVPGANYDIALSSDANFAHLVSFARQSANSALFTGLSGGVRYYFEVRLSTEVDWAYAGNRLSATTPTPAALSWTGETNYLSDGLDPETGTSTTTFVYRVKYSNANGDAPASGYPRVHIRKGGQELPGGPFAMAFVSGNYVSGAVYSYARLLSSGTDFTYYFEARDTAGDLAAGPPASAADAPDVSFADIYEPDDTSAAAAVIASGTPQAHSVIPAADVDWVRFTLPETSDITLETSGPPGANTRLWLYDPALVQIGYSDDIGGGNYFSRINSQGLAAGTYYAKVDENGGDSQIPWYYIALTISSGTALHPRFAQIYSSSATVAWDAVPGAGYQAVLASDALYSDIFSSAPAASNSASFTGLTPDTTWYFETKLSSETDRAYGTNRVSSVTLAVMPDLPLSGIYTEVNSSSITVNWSSGTAVSGYDPSGTLYNVELSTSAGFGRIAVSSRTVALSAGLAGLTPNTTYYSRAQAVNRTGIATPFKLLGSTVTLLAGPAPPAGAVFTLIYTASMTVNWSSGTAASGYNPAGTLYKAEISTAAGFIPAFASSQTYNLGAGFTGLTPNTSYYARALALIQGGASTQFVVLGSTSLPAAAPGRPAGGAYSQVYISSLTVNWSSGTAASGYNPAGTAYRAELSTSAAFAPVFASSQTYDLSAGFNGLSAYTTYYARARALDRSGAATAVTLLGSMATLSPAALLWSGETNYASDGLDPESGTSTAAFVYRVRYADANASPPAAGYPKVHIKKSGGEISGSPFAMTYISGAYDTGALYSYTVALGTLSTDYAYYFEAYDADGNAAAGPPVFAKDAPDVYDGPWQSANPMGTARYNHAAAALFGGRLLVTGGTGGGASAELYDPAANLWSGAAAMSVSRYSHTATLLPGGKVLVAGGGALASAELYDPDANSWSGAAPMSAARRLHTATLLPNGKVLVAGGYGGGYLSSAELYDPNTNSWSSAGSMTSARQAHTATLLPGGKVLVAGGYNGSGSLSAAELYDPNTNSWSGAHPMSYARDSHTAALLPDGRVLVAGGYGGSMSSSELYDPAANVWTSAGAMTSGRAYYTAAALPDGKVLEAGGFGGVGLSSSELYDPGANSWSAAAPMASARYYHAAALLPGGKVMVTGGYNGSSILSSAELFSHYPKVPLTQLSPALAQVASSGLSATWTAVPAANYTIALSSDASFMQFASSGQQSGNSAVFGGLQPATRYFFEVRLSTEADWAYAGNRLSSTTFAAMPDLPAGPVFTQVYAGSMTVTWSSGTAASGYNPAGMLYRAEISASAGFSPIFASSQTYNLGAGFAGLTPNASYYLRAQALANNGASSSFAILGSTITYAAAPGPAAGPVFTQVYGSSLTVNWSSGTAVPGYNPAGTLYKAELSTAANFSPVLFSSQTYNLNAWFGGLTPVTTYYARAQAINMGGAGTPFVPLGSTTTAVLLYLPSGGVFSGVYASSATVLWSSGTASAGYNPADALYKVEVSAVSDFSPVLASSQTYELNAGFTGLTPNTSYYFRAQAIGDGGATTAFAVLGSTVTNAAAPGLPAGSVFTQVYASSMTVNWSSGTAVPGYNPAGTLYKAELSTAASFGSVTASSQTYSLSAGFSGLTPDTTYYARAQAISRSGASTIFTVLGSASAAVPLYPPSGGAFSEVYSSSAAVFWSSGTASAGYNPADTRYMAEVSTAADFSPVSASSQTYNPNAGFSGLTPNTSYYFRARAIDHNGASTSFAVFGSTITNAAAPGLPAGPVFTQVYASSAAVNWSSGAAVPGYNPAGTLYEAELSTGASFSYVTVSSRTYGLSAWFKGLAPDTAYYARARAIGNSGASTSFAVLGATITYAVPPGPPPGPVFAQVYAGSMTLSWSSGTFAPGYNPSGTLYEAELSTAANFGSVTASSQTYALNAGFSGLTPNTSYYFRAQAIGRNGAPTLFSVFGSTATYAVPPAMPAGPVFTLVYASSIAVNWSSGTVAFGYDPAGTLYKVELSTAASFSPVTASSQTYDLSAGFSGLSPDTTYFVRAQAINMGGAGTSFAILGSTSTAVMLYPPSGGAFSGVYASSATVLWSSGTASAGYNTADTQYKAEVSAAADFSQVLVSSQTSNLNAGFAGLTPNTLYYFRAQAIAHSGASTAFVVLGSTITYAAAPGLPAGPVFTPVYASSMTVNWSSGTAAPGYNPAGTLYEVELSTAASFSPVAGSSQTYNINAGFIALTPDTTYYARALAINSGGAGTSYVPLGSTITAAALYPPSGGAFSGVYTSSVAVLWSSGTALTGYSPAGTLYKVEASTAADFAQVQVSSQTYNLNAGFAGLIPNTAYYFRAQAIAHSGASTAFVVLGSTITYAAAPGLPAGPVFTQIYASSMTVNWSSGSAALGYNPAGTLYRIELSTSAAFGAVLASSQVYALSAGLGALTPNTTCYGRVEALGYSGAGAFASLGAAATAANAPVQTTALTITSVSVSLDWQPNGDPEPGTDYELWRSTAPDFTARTSVLLSMSDCLIYGLSPSTTYYFKVRAVNKAGLYTAFDPPLTVLTNPPAPASLVLAGAASGVSSIRWTWNDAGGGAVYRILSSADADVSGWLPAGTTVWTETQLSTGAAYGRKAAAYNISGVSTSTLVTRYALAAPPAGSEFLSVWPSSAVVRWSANGDPPGTAFEAEYWTAGGSTVSLSVVAASAALAGLTRGTTVYARVRALNGDGIPSAYDLTISSFSQNLTAVIGGGTAYRLSYDQLSLEISPDSFSETVTVVMKPPAAVPPDSGGLEGFSPRVLADISALNFASQRLQPLRDVIITADYHGLALTGADEDSLVIATYDESRFVWVPLYSVRDKAAKLVTARAGHFSLFQLMRSASAGIISGMTVGPNPLRPALAPGAQFTFRHLPAGARVKIYTSSGELLRDTAADASGMAVWDGKNKAGRQVASDIYLALVEWKGEKKIVKLVVEK